MRTSSYRIRQAKNGQYYYVLKGGNNETLNKGEEYPDKANVKKGIWAARRASLFARIIDDTEAEQ